MIGTDDSFLHQYLHTEHSSMFNKVDELQCLRKNAVTRIIF